MRMSCLVIGANDVVNPAARTDKSSPIYGMPIINADHAKMTVVFKRVDGGRVRGDRERAVLRAAHVDAVRRREAEPAEAH